MDDGAGNPAVEGKLKTAYLWEDILQKERLSDILENYAQVIREKDAETGKIKEKCIWPRYQSAEAGGQLLVYTSAHEGQHAIALSTPRIGKVTPSPGGLSTCEHEAGGRTHSAL